MMDVSIVVVSFNTRVLLQDCLRSLFETPTRATFEVIVVDNASSDGSPEMVASQFPQVALIQLDSNQGYTLPMNLGLRRGGGRYLMQLNPDTLVQPGWLDELLAFMEARPGVGICTPKVMNRDGSLQRQCRRSAARPWDVFTYFSGLWKLFPDKRCCGGYLMTYMDAETTHPAEAVSGSCMLIRRAVVDQVGYLDEQFFAYQEDTEFCFRARQAGWQIYYVPAARIIHYGGQGGSRVQPYRAILQWHRSYYLYYKKHLAKDYFFLVNCLMYAGMALKLGASLLINLLRREKIVGSKKP
ncbi:MAG TPA: glycosyltransferase family 2 protein [Anaerolineaceae bacterium]|nr:glycosyltransferase family 2 protein [Anaerolineaceae bacterium]